MKNKVLIVCAGLLLLIFLAFGTYAWYLFFLRASGDFPINNNSKYLENSGIILKDNGNNVYDTKAESLEDDNISHVPAYQFQIINTIDKKGKYNIYIEDLPVNMVSDGCTEETLLDRSQLKYQLSLNGQVIKEGKMDTINDNILDSREIEPNTSNDYSLKIYIHDEATDWFGKHYHYKVSVNR